MAELLRLRPKRPCAICQKPSQQKFHPFCSQRCAQIDLGRWLGGQYAIPESEDAAQIKSLDKDDLLD